MILITCIFGCDKEKVFIGFLSKADGLKTNCNLIFLGI